jgi:hypothetical protein
MNTHAEGAAMPTEQRYRVKPSYEQPTGGFLAIGPIYHGEMSQDGQSVLFRHHGDHQWTETVAIDHLEVDPQEPQRRHRWK